MQKPTTYQHTRQSSQSQTNSYAADYQQLQYKKNHPSSFVEQTKVNECASKGS